MPKLSISSWNFFIRIRFLSLSFHPHKNYETQLFFMFKAILVVKWKMLKTSKQARTFVSKVGEIIYWMKS